MKGGARGAPRRKARRRVRASELVRYMCEHAWRPGRVWMWLFSCYQVVLQTCRPKHPTAVSHRLCDDIDRLQRFVEC